MQLRSRKFVFTLAVACLLSLGFVIGATAGRSDKAQKKGTRSQEYYDSLELFGRVYERITRNYVDELDPQELIDSAIEGMLDELDPHSQLLTPQSYEDLMTSTQGEFGGLGIQITVRDGWITVVSPIEGTPAYLMGIQGGDQIVEIEGESTEGWKTTDAVKKLRGPKGTQVTIGIRRPGEDTIRHYTITRDIIKLESVPYAFMIDEDAKVGYVRITNFARTTATELKTAIDSLKTQGMKRLLIDLRFNPGGLLSSAKEVSELFLKQGQLIVYTKGRYMRNNVSYYASGKSEANWDETPLLLLVNGSTASASEILSGAVQDHDVGLIAGQTTFGKGSVQTVFDLPPDRALKLTTARYYTPSGRSIHRQRTREGKLVDEQGKEVQEVKENPEKSEGSSPPGKGEEEKEKDDSKSPTPSSKAKTDEAGATSSRSEAEVFFTDMGRKVYGGGGITPDVELEPALLSDAEVCLERDGIFFTFATEYSIDHDRLTPDFEITPAMLDRFYEEASKRENLKRYLTEFGLEWNRQLMDDTLDYIKEGIRRELERHYHGSMAAYEVSVKGDDQLWKAVDLLRQADDRLGLFHVAEEYNARKLAEAEKKTAGVR